MRPNESMSSGFDAVGMGKAYSGCREASSFTFAHYGAPVPLYIVRHAKAGSRSEFDGDDRDRPLTNSGRKQAAELASRLAAVSPTMIVSSPYRRCLETLEPLGVAIDSEVHIDARLGEFGERQSRPDEALLELLHSVPDRSVLCSHGDVIPALIDTLADGGMRVNGEPQWGKASVWVVQRIEDRFVEAHAWPPPAID